MQLGGGAAVPAGVPAGGGVRRGDGRRRAVSGRAEPPSGVAAVRAELPPRRAAVVAARPGARVAPPRTLPVQRAAAVGRRQRLAGTAPGNMPSIQQDQRECIARGRLDGVFHCNDGN